MIRSLMLPWHNSMVKEHNSNLSPTPTFLLFSTPQQSLKEGWSTTVKHIYKSGFKAVQCITSRMLRYMEGVLKLASAWGAGTDRDGGGAQGRRWGSGTSWKRSRESERGRLIEETEWKRWEAG